MNVCRSLLDDRLFVDGLHHHRHWVWWDHCFHCLDNRFLHDDRHFSFHKTCLYRRWTHHRRSWRKGYWHSNLRRRSRFRLRWLCRRHCDFLRLLLYLARPHLRQGDLSFVSLWRLLELSWVQLGCLNIYYWIFLGRLVDLLGMRLGDLRRLRVIVRSADTVARGGRDRSTLRTRGVVGRTSERSIVLQPSGRWRHVPGIAYRSVGRHVPAGVDGSLWLSYLYEENSMLLSEDGHHDEQKENGSRR